MKDRLIYCVSLLLMVVGFSYWCVTTFRENVLFFLTPSEFYALSPDHQVHQHKRFRLGGLVAMGSVKRTSILMFRVIDTQGKSMDVHYEGLPPDLFREGQGVVAEGAWNGYFFKAERLLAKHDERYMPKEVADRLKQNQLWKKNAN